MFWEYSFGELLFEGGLLNSYKDLRDRKTITAEEGLGMIKPSGFDQRFTAAKWSDQKNFKLHGG